MKPLRRQRSAALVHRAIISTNSPRGELMTYSRKRLRRITATLSIVALAALAAACGGNDPKSTSTTGVSDTQAPVLTNAPTTTIQGATQGGSITVGLDAESSGYNPTADPVPSCPRA